MVLNSGFSIEYQLCGLEDEKLGQRLFFRHRGMKKESKFLGELFIFKISMKWRR